MKILAEKEVRRQKAQQKASERAAKLDRIQPLQDKVVSVGILAKDVRLTAAIIQVLFKKFRSCKFWQPRSND